VVPVLVSGLVWKERHCAAMSVQCMICSTGEVASIRRLRSGSVAARDEQTWGINYATLSWIVKEGFRLVVSHQ
jgi:hypothetical protein